MEVVGRSQLFFFAFHFNYRNFAKISMIYAKKSMKKNEMQKKMRPSASFPFGYVFCAKRSLRSSDSQNWVFRVFVRSEFSGFLSKKM